MIIGKFGDDQSKTLLVGLFYPSRGRGRGGGDSILFYDIANNGSTILLRGLLLSQSKGWVLC